MEARPWGRYKTIWPPEVAPSDLLLSRLVRELGKRLLSVKEVLKVKTQAQQQRMSRERTKMGEGIEIITGEKYWARTLLETSTPTSQDCRR